MTEILFSKEVMLMTTDINQEEFQEFIGIIGKLNDEQKKIVLATLRGAVLIADIEKDGDNDDSSRD